MKTVKARPAPLTDEFAWKLASHLVEDLKPFASTSITRAAQSAIADRSVVALRALTGGNDDSINPYQLKADVQILNLFKKFSFLNDVFTPQQLLNDSKKKFLANQERLHSIDLSGLDRVEHDVVWWAKGWIERVLGEYSDLEVCQRATFGKKSSVGVSMRHACEGARYEPPITGSADHILWFDKFYGAYNRPAYNYARARALQQSKDPYRLIDTLDAVLVDKTWKSLRMIMPNTTLGTLYSGGLGRLLEDRLSQAGYDIRALQPIHGKLAKEGSITGNLVTADQSMASDNITTHLIDLLLPRRWASALRFGRIGKLSLYGDTLETETFSTMGIGFTFPLQTLVFLGLLHGVRQHLSLSEDTVVSVFGDDLIYDVRMHDLVVHIFHRLGLVFNLDKTFATGFFRESCGQDFFRGIDVRPAILGRAEYRTDSSRKTEAYLYKTFNSLTARWSAYEVPSTLSFLIEEIRKIRPEPLRVPADFPATGGIKDFDSISDLGLCRTWTRSKSGTIRFPYLAFESKMRLEDRHAPYMFRALQTPSRLSPDFGPANKSVLVDNPEVFSHFLDVDGRHARPKLDKRVYRTQFTMIPEQDRGRYRVQTGVTSAWTPAA